MRLSLCGTHLLLTMPWLEVEWDDQLGSEESIVINVSKALHTLS
jgi:hypothetical protein